MAEGPLIGDPPGPRKCPNLSTLLPCPCSLMVYSEGIMNESILGVYELAPIGVNYSMEVVASYPFCSKRCRNAYMERWMEEMTLARGTFETSIDGLVCEHCSKSMKNRDK
jgi:hypothetical protein